MAALILEAQLFFLVFARIIALVQTAPLLSSGGVPFIAKTALAFFTALAVLPGVSAVGYPIPDAAGLYVLLLIGEAMVGIVIGFFLTVVYSVFLVSGQFFSLQMGFGASQVFDPLAQVQIPLMGQFLNVVAMLVFISTGGLQRIFLSGVYGSFQAMRAVDLAIHREDIVWMVAGALSRLFEQALIIAFPVLGTLMLISVTMGLLAKAAPQMNLLMLGFPIAISVAFILLFVGMPLIMAAFSRVIDEGFLAVEFFLSQLFGGSG
jgi:flagellar biosynthesis protein FliR